VCAEHPFTHHVKTAQDAAAFVIEVGNPNGVLLLDIWHAYRGGTPYATLPALVPPEVVFGVELDNGLGEVVGTDLEDTFARLQSSDTEIVQDPTDQPYGVRDCAVRDPAGSLIRIQQLS